MQPIEAVLLEPVGCLAEFPPEPFVEIAARLFARKRKPVKSASRAYWRLLNLMEQRGRPFMVSEAGIAEELEVDAATNAAVYEDVAPALAELKAMGVTLLLASSLSAKAVAVFLERSGLANFAALWSRDNAGGVKGAPILRAMRASGLAADRAMYLTDTAEGLKVAQGTGVQPVLMMNDPDEARRLALRGPAGGIVSMHELPDFLRLLRVPRTGF
jgi:phosphoglycolate phosphatase-like HAD superfamily hydrolase